MELVFDIEANGLLDTVTDVHCISMMSTEGNILPLQSFSSRPIKDSIGNIEQALDKLHEASTLIGHNITAYDLPLIKTLYGFEPDGNTKILDTYVMSRLFNPDRLQPPNYPGKVGPHSLESWGYRVGQFKPEHEDWSILSSAMLRRNREDVEINRKLYCILRSEMAGHNWTESLKIENEVSRIISKQELNGVKFDVDRAISVVENLDNLSDTIDDFILPKLPKKAKQKGNTIEEPFKKDGNTIIRAEKYLEDSCTNMAGPFSAIEFNEMNLGSMPQVKEYLLSIGWIPTEWNYNDDDEKTSPKLTEDSFGTIDGKVGRAIKERILIKHRKSQINGWITRVRSDGRLPAGADTCGTNTGRFRHNRKSTRLNSSHRCISYAVFCLKKKKNKKTTEKDKTKTTPSYQSNNEI